MIKESTPEHWNDQSEHLTNEAQDPLAETKFFKVDNKDGEISISEARKPSGDASSVKEKAIEDNTTSPSQQSKTGKSIASKGTPPTKSAVSNLKSSNVGRSGLGSKRY